MTPAHRLRALFQKTMLIELSNFLAQATPAAPAPGPQTSILDSIIPFAAILVIMWVLMIRPQQKKQKELAAKIASIKPGDRVVTIGGVHGTVTSIKEGPTLVMRVDENCKMMKSLDIWLRYRCYPCPIPQFHTIPLLYQNTLF